jgi:pimeloyl-ACP methyl ester carboxylesterase
VVRRRNDGSAAVPPLLLLHGFGASAFSWRLVFGPLAESRTVVAYDRPGFGLSERPRRGEWNSVDWPRGTPYSPEAQADLAIALLDRLAIDRAVIVGHSAGGAIAGIAATRHPARVAALVLVAADTSGPPGWALRAAGLPLVQPLMRSGVQLVVGQMRRFFELAWFDRDGIPADTVAGYVRPAALPGWEDALFETMAAGPLPDLVPGLADLGAPTLVVSGDHDRAVPRDQSRHLAAQIPGAVLEVIPACGHLPPEEQPRRFVNAVRRFLTGLPRR